MSAPVTAYHSGFNDLSLTPVSPSCPSDLLQAGRPVNFYQTPLSWSANKNLGGRFIQVSEAQPSSPQPYDCTRSYSSIQNTSPFTPPQEVRETGL